MPVVIINFLAFQAGWFACVLGGAWGWPWLGVGMIVGVVALHVFLSPRAGPELRLIAAAATIGLLWDSTLAAAGVLVYASGQLVSLLAPVWIVALWTGFATSINVTLRWMKGRHLLAAAIGAVAGPMSFWGGSRLGAVSFPDPVLALTVLSVGWGLLLPLLVALGERFDGWHPDSSATKPAA